MTTHKKQALNKDVNAIKILLHIIFIVVCVACIYPFLVILGSSFQSQNDIMMNGYLIIPKEFSLTAYRMILRNPHILLNSYLITAITTLAGSVAGLWIVSGYAYALSRKSFKYRKQLSFYIFFTMLFNGGMVPSYIMMVKWLGLKNNILALILPMLVNSWYVLLMKGFLQTMSESLVESAKIDGAGEVYAFIKIVLPICNPPLPQLDYFWCCNTGTTGG